MLTLVAGFVFALVLGVGVALPHIGHAESPSQGDEAVFRAMISGQIDAFRRDDGAAAYDYASPMIRGLFPSPDQFMAMVRNAYQPVYRPREVVFGSVTDSPGGPLQKVLLTGPDGRRWVAIYTMQQQADGTWKINGCTLVPDDGASI
jgi:hypothetical protein